MNMDIKIILAILFIHWVADFVMQSDWQAQNKSKLWSALLTHTLIYSNVWIYVVTIMLCLTTSFSPSDCFINGLIFALITFAAHTITDYFTSRLNRKLWEEKKVHWFFVSVGFDQVLHYFQLILTYYYLTPQ